MNIDEKSRTSIKGLFAAGEIAGGPHGADRLGGNMVLTCQVYGKRAGRYAAEYVKENDFKELPLGQIEEENQRIQAMLRQRGTIKPQLIKKKLQEIMWRHVLVTRTEESLSLAIKELKSLSEACKSDIYISNKKQLMHALGAENLIMIGEIISRAARLRKETRGSHFRVDYPQRDDQNFFYRITTRLENDEIRHRTIDSDPEMIRRYPYEIVHG